MKSASQKEARRTLQASQGTLVQRMLAGLKAPHDTQEVAILSRYLLQNVGPEQQEQRLRGSGCAGLIIFTPVLPGWIEDEQPGM